MLHLNVIKNYILNVIKKLYIKPLKTKYTYTFVVDFLAQWYIEMH